MKEQITSRAEDNKRKEDINILRLVEYYFIKQKVNPYNVPIYWTTVLGGYGRIKRYETSIA